MARLTAIDHSRPSHQKINCQTFSCECLNSEIRSNESDRTLSNVIERSIRFVRSDFLVRRSRVVDRGKSRQNARHLPPVVIPLLYVLLDREGTEIWRETLESNLFGRFHRLSWRQTTFPSNNMMVHAWGHTLFCYYYPLYMNQSNHQYLHFSFY